MKLKLCLFFSIILLSLSTNVYGSSDRFFEFLFPELTLLKQASTMESSISIVKRLKIRCNAMGEDGFCKDLISSFEQDEKEYQALKETYDTGNIENGRDKVMSIFSGRSLSRNSKYWSKSLFNSISNYLESKRISLKDTIGDINECFGMATRNMCVSCMHFLHEKFSSEINLQKENFKIWRIAKSIGPAIEPRRFICKIDPLFHYDEENHFACQSYPPEDPSSLPIESVGSNETFYPGVKFKIVDSNTGKKWVLVDQSDLEKSTKSPSTKAIRKYRLNNAVLAYERGNFSLVREEIHMAKMMGDEQLIRAIYSKCPNLPDDD